MSAFTFTPQVEQLGGRLVPSTVAINFDSDVEPPAETRRVVLPGEEEGFHFVKPGADVEFHFVRPIGSDPPGESVARMADPPGGIDLGQTEPPDPDMPGSSGGRIG